MIDSSWPSGNIGKVTALLMFKNEEANIPTFMNNIHPFVDEILGYDDNSTDKSALLFLENGGKLIQFTPSAVWANGGENQIRQALLDEGRRRGGQFFAVLDCDEAFNSLFVHFFANYLHRMTPGQSLQLKWINLWGSKDRFCSANSVWQPSYREFVFRDHPTLIYGSGGLHSFGRAPKAVSDFGFLNVAEDHGVVLHSQFVNWEKVQVKQAWYRLQEFLYTAQSMYAINKKYKITLEQNVETLPLPPNWQPETKFQDQSIENSLNKHWHLLEIQKIIDEYGIEKFRKIDIWKSETMARIWRDHSPDIPRPSRWMGIREFLGFCLWYVKKLGTRK